MSTNRPDERVHIVSKIIGPDGPAEIDLPAKAVAIGQFTGDAATGYNLSRPLAITRKNLPSLAGLKPTVEDIEVPDHLTGAEGKRIISKLVFTRGTNHWVAQIVEQVPELRAMQILLDALLEVKRNPRLRKQLADWLATDPDAGQALSKLVAAASEKR